MIVSRQELIFKIINILDLYFKDSRAYDFTLFFWPKKKADGLIQLDIKFNWKATESNEFIVSSSAYCLFEPQNFKSPFMFLESNKEVSAFIAANLSNIEIESDEFMSNFSLVNGVNLHRETWNKTMGELLGFENVTEYYAEQRFAKLSSLLLPKDIKDKLIKI
jgi:hypothetical protein